MRRFVLSAAVVGLGFLVALLLRSPAPVSSLKDLLPGIVVSLEGVASDWRFASYGSSFSINSIPIFCECSQSYEGIRVHVVGVVERYPERLRVHVLSIKKSFR